MLARVLIFGSGLNDLTVPYRAVPCRMLGSGLDGEAGGRDSGDWDEYYSKEMRRSKKSGLVLYGG